MATPNPSSQRPWAAGDVAVCVGPQGGAAGEWINALTGVTEAGPRIGQYVHVIDVASNCLFPPPDIGLEFREFPDALYPSTAFRRIEPDVEAGDDVELAERVRRCGASVPA